MFDFRLEIWAFSASLCPVVPMTNAFRCSAQTAANCAVASWKLKSITTSTSLMSGNKSSPRSIWPATCSSGLRSAQATSVWPMRPLAPVMMILVGFKMERREIQPSRLRQHAATSERRPEHLAVLRIHRHQGQTVFLFDASEHRQRRFDRDRVGLDEQVLEQRIKSFVQFQRSDGPAGRKGANHVADFARNQIRGDADNPLRADGHKRQRQRIIAAQNDELWPERGPELADAIGIGSGFFGGDDILAIALAAFGVIPAWF